MGRLDKLRELAQAATPGPWEWVDPGDTYMPVLTGETANVCDFGDSEQFYPIEGTPPSDADCAFIAAANPTVILSLLDALDAAEARARDAERVEGKKA